MKPANCLPVGAAAPLQEAAITALELPDSYYNELQRLYTEKRTMFLEYLEAAGLRYTEPQGAYYVMVDISEFGWKSDVAFCEWMAKEVGIAVVPGSSFFHEKVNHLIRFHFAKRAETLAAAGGRLLHLRSKLASVVTA
jgi:aspartate/methionine/tyrosine aminotransferase